ncbi:hypothetical protein BDV19DRAFT_363304 [Aspergillus venezuelensis]
MAIILRHLLFTRALRHVKPRQHMTKLQAALSTNTDYPNPHQRGPLARIDDTLCEEEWGPAKVKKGASRWGFALYRCAYDAKYDNNWKRMLDLINSEVVDSLELEERMDLLSTHQLSIIEDPARFEGATSHQLREHFSKIWVPNEVTRILRDPSHRTCRVYGPDGVNDKPVDSYMGPRYTHCLFADEICLESLDETSTRPVIKALIVDWEQTAPEWYQRNSYKVCDDHGYEDGLTDYWAEDVGWMYIEVYRYVEWFDKFTEPWDWDLWYRRPPDLGFSSLPGMVPGEWRKKGRSAASG